MTVTVMSDVGGSTLTLNVNGARLTMDQKTAWEVAHFLSIALEQLAHDQIAKRMECRLTEAYHHANG